MTRWQHTFVHYYYGTGKGKTTSAFGQALRLVGRGGTVYIGQFIKTMRYGEVIALERYLPQELCRVELYGHSDCLIERSPSSEDIDFAHKGLARAHEQLLNGEYDLVIWDEVATAIGLGLLSPEEVISALQQRPPNCELILTGRSYIAALIEHCHLVTNFDEVKHYYQSGIELRDGIEC